MDSNLTVRVEAVGAPQAADDLSKVADATSDVARAAGQSTGETEKLAESQKNVSANQRNWLGLLRQLSPELGEFANDILNAEKVTRELASGSSLLGAAGAAVIPVLVGVALAAKSIREEFAAAARSMREAADAMTDIQKARMGRAADVEQLSGLRREGPIGAEESRMIAIAAGGVLQRVPASTEKERERLADAASQAALIAGPEADTATLDDLAIVLANVKGVSVENLVRPGPARAAPRVQRLIGRHRNLIDTIRAREAQQVGIETPAAAITETAAGGAAGQAQVEEFIRGLPGEAFTGQNIPMLAKIAATLPGLSPEDLRSAQLSFGYLKEGDPFDAKFAGLQTRARALRAKGIEGVEPEHVRSAEFILRQLERPDAGSVPSQAAPTTVNHYYQQNQRHTYPDSASQQRAIDRSGGNGEAKLRNAEDLMLQGR